MTFNIASFDEIMCIMKNGAKETTEKEQNKVKQCILQENYRA